MKTTIINHQQRSPEWHAHRRTHRNASDAAAMFGMPCHKTRDQLIKEIATGITEEVDAYTQKLFAMGHEYEETARPWAQEILGAELYPIVLAGEHNGLKLSASLDGATLLGDVNFEHKMLNAELAASLDLGVIPDEYHPQMEQGLMLSGAEQCLFMASSGDKAEMRWAWYVPNDDLADRIIAGWRQLENDVANYTPTETQAKPVGHAPESLPALRIAVTGMVTESNIVEFKQIALGAIRSVNRDLVTDQDFADSAKARRWCADIEAKAKAAKQHALSQTATIDDLFRALDDIGNEARETRIALERIEKTRNAALKTEIVTSGQSALAAHIAQCNASIGKRLMPSIAADFAGAIKGMSNFDNMRNAVNTELANAKIKADAVADQITCNLQTIKCHADHEFLFADTAALVLKSPDDLAAVVQNRIAAHQAKEAARIEADRERIAAEERSKAEAEAQARADAEIAQARATAQEEARAAADAQMAIERAAEPETVTVRLVEKSFDFGEQPHASQPTLRLGQICERLGFNVTAEFLSGLGFEPCATDKNAKLYKERIFPLICRELVRHIQSVSQGVEA